MPDNTYRLNWFSIPDSFGHFVVVTKNKIDSSASNGNLNFSQVITLTNFDSGKRIIPPLAFSASTLEGDSTFTVYTDSIPVNVSYSPTDSIMPFHDIKAIMEVKTQWPWWVWALGILGILLVAALVIFLVKYFRKKKDPETLFVSKLTPYEEAMQSLKQVEEDRLLPNNKIKEFHSRLSDIFKRYLSRKTNANQMHLTADELLMKLNEFDLPKEQVNQFASCLRMGNAVKFAQYIPPNFENEKCFSQVKEIIIAANTISNKKPENDL